MNECNISLTSTFSTIPLNKDQLFNETSTSTPSSISRNFLMRYLHIIYVASIVILGVSGNILCVIVFCTKSLRRIRSSAYLFTLALSDAFFILDLLPGMLHMAFVTDLYRKIDFICNIQNYVSFVASFVHIWMVLVFTAERFYAVNFPLKHMSQCTPNLSRIVILIVIVPAFIFYIHPAFFVSKVDNKGQCREKAGYERYLSNLNIIDTIMTMFLPFILVLILNILIIRKLFCSKTFRQHAFANGSRYRCQHISNGRKRAESPLINRFSLSLSPLTNLAQSDSPESHRLQRIARPFRSKSSPTTVQHTLYLYRPFITSVSSPSDPNKSNPSTTKQQESMKPKSILSPKRVPSSKRADSAQRHVLTELRLTKMLLAISLTCLLLNFPSYYLRFMILYEPKDENASSDISNSNDTDFAFYRSVIFHYVSYLSYSINIFIYLLFGGNFRRALKRLFSLTPSNSEAFNKNLRRKTFGDYEQQDGNMTDYDSTVMTSGPTNGSIGDHSKHIKLREQSSLHH